MDEYLQAFALGNAAILGNVCMLPLYPGLLVMLAGRAEAGAPARSTRWAGAVVLAGILTVMVAVGFLLQQLNRSAADVLPWVLPALYGLVAVLGVAMLLDRNPFARLATTEAPVLRSPMASAYLYGVALGPMTLPCTGPLIVSAFVIGGVGGTGALADSLAYFLFFGLGFGWPLVALPLLAAPAQQRITRFLARHHRVVTVASGVLLLVVATIGVWNDVVPNLR